MEREKLATGGVLGLSVLIASCCLGPTLFLLFGVSIGALGALGALEPLRPYAIAAGGVLLAWAGWRILRPAAAAAAAGSGAAAACEDDACAPDGAARRRVRRLYWLAVAAYALSVVYPTLVARLID